MTFKRRTLDLINASRAQANVGPLQHSSALEEVAQDRLFTGGGVTVRGRADDMGARNYLLHGVLGSNPPQGSSHMLTAAGITTFNTAENIAFMAPTKSEDVAAQNIHNQFLSEPNTPGTHLFNLLNPIYTHVGIGLWRSFEQPWTGGGGTPIRVFLTCQVFAKDPSPVTLPGARYHPVSPMRVLDTRMRVRGPMREVGPGASIDIQITGAPGVPDSGVSAVVLNMTVVHPSANGFLTVFPTGEARPVASNLNFTPGTIVANLVVVKVGAGGRVTVFNSGGNTHVLADVAGWFDDSTPADGGRYHPITPARILDTRPGAPVGPGATLDLAVAGQGGLPAAGVSAAVVNLTVTETTAPGFLTVFPAGEPRPVASNVNFRANHTVANLAVAKLGAGGAISNFNANGNTELVVDVGGWFDDGTLPTGGRFHPVTPSRILDTRIGRGAPTAPLGGGATLQLQVAGVGSVPVADVAAVAMNVTAVFPTAASFLTVFPTGEPQPPTSNIGFTAGDIVPNLVMAKLGSEGRVSIFNAAGAVDVLADVAGWFDAG